ncbi:chemotaxis CheC--inhibitor of MCP methylation domain protein, partial [Vibrio paracholerae 87395]
MSFPVLICDDSPLARKQMARSLPASLNADCSGQLNLATALESAQNRRSDSFGLNPA